MDGLVLTAAGSSSRFGGTRSKVLTDLAGTPVLVRALEAFREALPDVAVVITARAEDAGAVRALVPDAAVVAGGTTRQESVGIGLAALPEDVEVIFVHDAARPLVTREVVERVRLGALEDGAAAAVLPVRDTLHRMQPGSSLRPDLGPGVDRAGLACAQTPQAARADAMRAAFARAQDDGFEGTDEVSLLLHAAVRVAAVAGEARNIKVTEPADLELARLLLAHGVSA